MTVGFIGLGAMGSQMAARLHDHLNELVVFDTRDETMTSLVAQGAVSCTSPADVAQRCTTVFVSLPTPEIVSDVVVGPNGLLAGKGALTTYVDLSTTGPTVAAQVASALSGAGIGYLDAPVSGGPGGAEKGTLTIIASGQRALFDELEPLFRVLGTNVFHVGDQPGQGQLTKILNNLMSACAIAITGEAVALGVKGGLDPARLLEVINVSSGRNTASADKFPRCVLPRTFDFGFRMKLMLKDVGLCLQEASQQKVPMVLGSTIQQLWSIGDAGAASDADCTELAKLFEQWAGVTITGPPS